jgi:hypothetical protein
LGRYGVVPLKEPTNPVKLLDTLLKLPETSFSTAWSNDKVLVDVPLVKPLRPLARDVLVLETFESSRQMCASRDHSARDIVHDYCPLKKIHL